jgi:hypothetical protein
VDERVAVIADLVASDAIAPWVDPAAMASLLMAGANGIALQSCLDPGGPSLAAMSGQLALPPAGGGGPRRPAGSKDDRPAGRELACGPQRPVPSSAGRTS